MQQSVSLDHQHLNLSAAQLYEAAVARGEGRITAHGALVVSTGRHTGRSPNDKFIVRDATTERAIWWDNNRQLSPENFARLRADFIAHAKEKQLFVQDLYGGSDPAHRLSVRVSCEYAWHALFIRHLLIRPEPGELAQFAPGLTIIDLPSFRADPLRHGTRSETVIGLDLTNRLVLIGGSTPKASAVSMMIVLGAGARPAALALAI